MVGGAVMLRTQPLGCSYVCSYVCSYGRGCNDAANAVSRQGQRAVVTGSRTNVRRRRQSPVSSATW